MKAGVILGYIVAPLAVLGIAAYLLWPRKSRADVATPGASTPGTVGASNTAATTAAAAAALSSAAPAADTTGVHPPMTEQVNDRGDHFYIDEHGFCIQPSYNQDDQNFYEGKRVKDVPVSMRQWFVNDMVAKLQRAAGLGKGERLRNARGGYAKFLGASPNNLPFETFLIRSAPETKANIDQVMGGWADPDHMVATMEIKIQDLGFWGDVANVMGAVTGIVRSVT